MDSRWQAAGHSAGTLWFNPPGGEKNRRRALTRDRVVAEALAIISAGGAAALSMRALATRLGVVPAALYRHVGSKEQLYDLVLDRVLAEVDCQADPALPWTGQVTALARRLRAVLEDHPGILFDGVNCTGNKFIQSKHLSGRFKNLLYGAGDVVTCVVAPRRCRNVDQRQFVVAEGLRGTDQLHLSQRRLPCEAWFES